MKTIKVHSLQRKLDIYKNIFEFEFKKAIYGKNIVYIVNGNHKQVGFIDFKDNGDIEFYDETVGQNSKKRSKVIFGQKDDEWIEKVYFKNIVNTYTKSKKVII